MTRYFNTGGAAGVESWSDNAPNMRGCVSFSAGILLPYFYSAGLFTGGAHFILLRVF